MNRLVSLMAVAGVFCAGCAKNPPPVTQVDGEVLLDGQPLPFAQITFVPDLEHFGAEMNSTGQTDEKGWFTVTQLPFSPLTRVRCRASM